jgi:hypothetical protein
MNEFKRFIGNLLDSIFYRIRFNIEYAADRKIRNVINQEMNKHHKNERQEEHE